MITSHRKENLKVSLASDLHEISSDVSISLGGDGSALNPHELLEAALAACTSITVSMYARHKKWDLTDIKVKVQTVKEGPENIMSRVIEFIGELDQEQKTRLLDVANKCPIHKLLSAQVNIETRAV